MKIFSLKNLPVFEEVVVNMDIIDVLLVEFDSVELVEEIVVEKRLLVRLGVVLLNDTLLVIELAFDDIVKVLLELFIKVLLWYTSISVV